MAVKYGVSVLALNSFSPAVENFVVCVWSSLACFDFCTDRLLGTQTGLAVGQRLDRFKGTGWTLLPCSSAGVAADHSFIGPSNLLTTSFVISDVDFLGITASLWCVALLRNKSGSVAPDFFSSVFSLLLTSNGVSSALFSTRSIRSLSSALQALVLSSTGAKGCTLGETSFLWTGTGGPEPASLE